MRLEARKLNEQMFQYSCVQNMCFNDAESVSIIDCMVIFSKQGTSTRVVRLIVRKRSLTVT